jgi:hypothetical protein
LDLVELREGDGGHSSYLVRLYCGQSVEHCPDLFSTIFANRKGGGFYAPTPWYSTTTMTTNCPRSHTGEGVRTERQRTASSNERP